MSSILSNLVNRNSETSWITWNAVPNRFLHSITHHTLSSSSLSLKSVHLIGNFPSRLRRSHACQPIHALRLSKEYA